jgi:hypothetical protein
MPAAEGTILHSFMEDCLREDCDAFHFVGETREHDGYKLELTDELADLLQVGLDEIDTIPGKLFVERRVDLGRWMPDQFGTCDVGIVDRKCIHIWDHKFGYLPVSPVENEQLMLYGLGFWDNIARHHTDTKNFRLHIFQPRAPGGGGEWDVSLDDLLAFGVEVKKKARATYDEDAPRIPGKVQCAYCDGAKTLRCPEYNEFHLKLIVDEFDEMDEAIELGVGPRLRPSNLLTPERRSFIIENWPSITKWYERLHADALDDAIRGLPVPGLKAVMGRNPPRKWRDEVEVEPRLKRALGEDAYTKKLVSPTQAEKLLPPSLYSKLASEHLAKREPKPTLVSEHDSREPVASVIDLFDDD